MINPKLIIKEKLQKWLDEKNIKADFEVSMSENLKFGDFSTNISLQVSNKLVRSPIEIAEEIKEEIESLRLEQFDKVEVAGSGFINFYLSDQYIKNALLEIIEKNNNFGVVSSEDKKTVIVEYSSPNIAKPFTVGHLRSTIIGDAIANLYEVIGYDVKRDNHLGDWGSQFGKQIYAIKTWGNENEIERSENPVKELVRLYVKFHEEAEKNPDLDEQARIWFKKLEDGDLEARRIWKKCVDWSMIEFDRLYKLLGIKFTENSGLGYGESFFEDKMAAVIGELKEKGLLKKDQGAELVYFENDKYPPLMILKKDGATLYATRDLATDKFRLQMYPGAVIINEVGIEQELYFRQLFEVEKMLGWIEDGQRIHVKHGHFRFKDGKMSTRKGNTIWLEDVVKEAIERAAGLGESNDDEIVKKIAVGALKWNDLKRNSEQEITFDWDDILNMHGNSGPYMQYAYARINSIIEKSEVIDVDFKVEKLELEEKNLLRFLSIYPLIVEKSAKNFTPNILANYLFELAQKFNVYYEKHKIIGSDLEKQRLLIVKATGQVIKNGLNLLGIETVERM